MMRWIYAAGVAVGGAVVVRGVFLEERNRVLELEVIRLTKKVKKRDKNCNYCKWRDAFLFNIDAHEGSTLNFLSKVAAGAVPLPVTELTEDEIKEGPITKVTTTTSVDLGVGVPINPYVEAHLKAAATKTIETIFPKSVKESLYNIDLSHPTSREKGEPIENIEQILDVICFLFLRVNSEDNVEVISRPVSSCIKILKQLGYTYAAGLLFIDALVKLRICKYTVHKDGVYLETLIHLDSPISDNNEPEEAENALVDDHDPSNMGK